MSLYCVPLYDSLGENAIEYIINHSEATIVFVASDKMDKLALAMPHVLDLVKTVVYWGAGHSTSAEVSGWHVAKAHPDGQCQLLHVACLPLVQTIAQAAEHCMGAGNCAPALQPKQKHGVPAEVCRSTPQARAVCMGPGSIKGQAHRAANSLWRCASISLLADLERMLSNGCGSRCVDARTGEACCAPRHQRLNPNSTGVRIWDDVQKALLGCQSRERRA